ncbi:DJ-1/PfpI family protein [Lentzea sp. BCCO 10_0061]|uniref:DJ-1/PfpI family protein n=1 Tax=Lentzea sokolovensis TaxID=3095429 RepID=A0ABU4UQ48_9PSEU|nr:DJ-1/PfpI family protein [Lentzea sp. BCCO 10_0061]MDX8141613.1 DJ-1/PfpI family protein [Lentzea sp. BCCO 10_0061]
MTTRNPVVVDMLEGDAKPVTVAILVAPGYAPVDIVGIHTIFGVLPGVDVHLVGKDAGEVMGEPAYPTRPTTTFADCPADVDILYAGAVGLEVFEDEQTLEFLADRGSRAGWVAGSCAGSLLLGAAGLLKGYRATTNFHFYDELDWFGAKTVETPNVVEDRNRISAGPATGCIEIALRLVQVFFGDEAARQTELNAEYAPQPLFGVGTPALAGPELTRRALAESGGWTQTFTASARRAADKLDASAAV